MPVSRRSCRLGVALTLVLAAVAAAQIASGRLSGTVATSDGARLPHATLTLVDAASAHARMESSGHIGKIVLQVP